MDNLTGIKFFLPELALSATSIVLIFLSLFKHRRGEKVAVISSYACIGGLVIAGGFTFLQWGMERSPLFSGLLILDRPAVFFKMLFLFAAILAVVLSQKSKELANDMPEYFALITGMTLGMNLLAESVNILMIYLSLEFVSLMSYLLVAYVRNSVRSSEAGLKYVLFGAAASGVFLYGASLFYGITGTLNFSAALMPNGPVAQLALIFMLAGFLYKVAAVPMQAWCPDAYEGAPIPITAFLSVAPKAAGFAVLMRVLSALGLDLNWTTLIAVISAVTMTFGNLAAIPQSNVKRLLAYSSIAHAGYLLMGIACGTPKGFEAVYFYFIAYALMNIGAFLVVEIIANKFGAETIETFAGLAHRGIYGSMISAAMTIFLLSLTGIPPFIGFIGKFYIFSAVIDAKLYWLAIVGIVNSVISLYYYMRIAKAMFFETSRDHEHIHVESKRLAFVMAVLAIAVTALGLAWQWMADISSAI